MEFFPALLIFRCRMVSPRVVAAGRTRLIGTWPSVSPALFGNCDRAVTSKPPRLSPPFSRRQLQGQAVQPHVSGERDVLRIQLRTNSAHLCDGYDLSLIQLR